MAEAAKQYPFSWQGKDPKGTVIKGTLVAVNEAAVRASLRRQGLVPTQIRRKSTLFQKRQKITTADIALFSRQLATMMQAGHSRWCRPSTSSPPGTRTPRCRSCSPRSRRISRGGTTLADALAKHPLYFDDLFVNLVNSGEQAGALETLLDKIATYKEKTEAIKKKIKKALTYPAAVLVVAVVVTAILLIFVIPQFEGIFTSFGADLPAFTDVRHRHIGFRPQ